MPLTKLNSASVIERLPVGSVIQTKSVTKTDVATSSSSTFADISGLSLSITPISTSSTILITGNINGSWRNNYTKLGVRLMRDSTPIAIGDDDGGTRGRFTGKMYLSIGAKGTFCIPVMHEDSPATTSAITYKWQFASLDNVASVYINRDETYLNDATYGLTVSSITVQEIKG
jgi:hypothetical protein